MKQNPLVFLKQNLFTLALIAGPIPFLLLILHFFSAMQTLQISRERVGIVEEKTARLSQQKQKNEQLLAKLKKSEPQYLEKSLESLTFSAVASGENQLVFQEETPRRSEQFEEVEIKQKQPVLLNEEELKKVLSLIEVEESAPLLLFKNFTLAKKITEFDEELYEVQCELIKREPIKN